MTSARFGAPMPTEEYLAELLEEWQERLGLQSWDMAVKYASDVETQGMTGRSWVQAGCEAADIYLLRPSDRGESFRQMHDPELDLVHELVHIRFWSIDPPEAEGLLHKLREVAIEKTARALVKLKREGR